MRYSSNKSIFSCENEGRAGAAPASKDTFLLNPKNHFRSVYITWLHCSILTSKFFFSWEGHLNSEIEQNMNLTSFGFFSSTNWIPLMPWKQQGLIVGIVGYTSNFVTLWSGKTINESWKNCELCQVEHGEYTTYKLDIIWYGIQNKCAWSVAFAHIPIIRRKGVELYSWEAPLLVRWTRYYVRHPLSWWLMHTTTE